MKKQPAKPNWIPAVETIAKIQEMNQFMAALLDVTTPETKVFANGFWAGMCVAKYVVGHQPRRKLI